MYTSNKKGEWLVYFFKTQVYINYETWLIFKNTDKTEKNYEIVNQYTQHLSGKVGVFGSPL